MPCRNYSTILRVKEHTNCELTSSAQRSDFCTTSKKYAEVPDYGVLSRSKKSDSGHWENKVIWIYVPYHLTVTLPTRLEEEHLLGIRRNSKVLSSKRHNSPASSESQSSLESSSSCPETVTSLVGEFTGSETVLLLTTATSVVGD